MTTWMALFGLVWLLRVRESLCGCSACRRARRDVQCTLSSTRSLSPERDPCNVEELTSYMRDATVQTDFEDDEAEDLDKIDQYLPEKSSTCSFECQNEAPAQRPRCFRPDSGSSKVLSDSDSEAVWERVEVSLERGASGLGLSIAGAAGGGDVSITRLADNGAAKNDGRLQIGDILEQVNSTSVKGAPHSAAVDALQRAGDLVQLKVRRARRPQVVTIRRGTHGLGLGIAGGSDNAAGGGGIFVSHIAEGAAHLDGRLSLGDKILAVRDQDGIETSLVGATHAKAVAALRSAGDRVTLVVLPSATAPPITRPAPQLCSMRSQATSCSTLHELLEDESTEIPRCVRMVRLVRSGSRLGMDIIGGLGGNADTSSNVDDACGVFVSGVVEDGAAQGSLHRGDRILSVDGIDLTRATHEQAAAALKYSGGAVTITAQYQPEQYERLRAKIRAINAVTATTSPDNYKPLVHMHPAQQNVLEPHVVYPR